MEFLAWWVLKSKVFAQKSTVVKKNCFILWIDIVWGLQNLDLILESKVVQKLSLEKNGLSKKCSPKLIFLNDFFFKFHSFLTYQKYSSLLYFCDIHRKMTLKVQFSHFFRPCRYFNFKNTAILFEYSWFLSKNLAF